MEDFKDGRSYGDPVETDHQIFYFLLKTYGGKHAEQKKTRVKRRFLSC